MTSDDRSDEDGQPEQNDETAMTDTPPGKGAHYGDLLGDADAATPASRERASIVPAA